MRSRFLKIRQNYACHEGNYGLSHILGDRNFGDLLGDRDTGQGVLIDPS
ncbi:MAG TPA: hypothetical protein VG815_05170 [Chloroflexota bacterium]|jgi:hypothetical protein|nr:hypothetical protein [Chloroflexota bacterium]